MGSSAISKTIRSFLNDNRDADYQAFQSKLIPSIPSDSIIGVRTPVLRRFSKDLAKRDDVASFLSTLPHKTFEENQLHAFIVGEQRDYDTQVEMIQHFLPFVDNWATCDQMSPKRLSARPEETLALAKEWMSSDEPYTIRYGIGVLLQLFLEDRFEVEHLELVAAIESPEYYVNMMRAWYYAEAVAKQPEAAIPFLEQQRLDKWTQNKAIQKARESRRVSQETKDRLTESRL